MPRRPVESDAPMENSASFPQGLDSKAAHTSHRHDDATIFINVLGGDHDLIPGVLEDGQITRVEEGAPQGASASPLLANLYLHYVLDLWIQQWRRKTARGDVIVVRWADDFIVGFQYEEEAVRFLNELRTRFAKFDLELHPEKTRLIEFGRFAVERRKRCGRSKPETFDFLGFTHIAGKTRNGKFVVIRRTAKTRFRRKLRELKEQLRRAINDPSRR